MGADSATRVWDAALERTDGAAVARVLAAVAQQVSFDLILCGRVSIDDALGEIQLDAGQAEAAAHTIQTILSMDPPDAEFLRCKLRAHVYPQLRKAPYFGPCIRKLRGYTPETWRCKLGRFRVFYYVDEVERMVFILTVDDRKDAYK
jgi:mRNA interferase RelE/StbE